MEAWIMWLIIIGIGIVVGFIVHAAIKYTQGSEILATLLAGVLGALLAARFVPPFVGIPELSLMTERFIWALAGSAVLSLIVELSYAGTKQGRVVTT